LRQLTHNGLEYYQFEQWTGLFHGIFTRLGGVSQAPWASLNMGGNVGDNPAAVRRNHELAYETLRVKGSRACTVWQVHGVDTVIADGPVRGRRWLALADGMMTDRADTPLVMRFADCAPILCYDPIQGIIAMGHAGWRGTVQGMSASLVRAMVQAYGCKPGNLQAGIGPSIGPRRYQVGEEVVAAVQSYYGTMEGLIHRDPNDGSAYFDLWTANRLDLERAGVEQIEIAGICTAEYTDEFFSHRAEKGHTGRFGVILSL
jgi:YfiH family protein